MGMGQKVLVFNLRVSKVIALGGRERQVSRVGSGGPGGNARRSETGPCNLGPALSDASAWDHKYTLTVSVAIRNIPNHNNPGPIMGSIESPPFGQGNQPYGVGTLGGTGFLKSADNRRLELQTRFTF
jgi:hypothetical protein